MNNTSTHHVPDKEAIERNKKIEPEGERIRQELIDFLERNKIVTMSLDTDEHCVSVDIVRLPPEIKPVLRSWGSIYVRNEPLSSPAQGTPEPPKVEELARQIGDVIEKYEADHRIGQIRNRMGEIEATLRPYFPPASQTPQSCPSAETFVDNFLRGNLWLSAEHEAEKRDAIAVLLKNYAKHLLAIPASTARTDRDLRQVEVAEWCAAAFGADQCSVPMRGLRMLEEAIEAYQSATIGLPTEEMTAKAHALVDYVMNRLAGNLAQECGGVGLTLLALCQAAGISAEAEELREIARVKSKPLAHFHQRNQAKNEAGFELAAPGSVPPLKDEDSYVAWCRYAHNAAGETNGIRLCDSDSPGAFKVYRHPGSVPQAEPPKSELEEMRHQLKVKDIAATAIAVVLRAKCSDREWDNLPEEMRVQTDRVTELLERAEAAEKRVKELAGSAQPGDAPQKEKP